MPLDTNFHDTFQWNHLPPSGRMVAEITLPMVPFTDPDAKLTRKGEWNKLKFQIKRREEVTKKIQSTEFIICGIINRVTASLLAVMVVVTLVAWLSLITVLTPSVPEGVRINAARVIWAYIRVGDVLRKEFTNSEI